MGEVWLAEDERLGRQVAIKRVRSDHGLTEMGPETRRRLRQEARSAARLAHPAVARIYDLIEDDPAAGGDALVMEHVEGPTLAELLTDGPLPLFRACRLARQVAEGLAAAHSRGLVHRDLKAENVIATRDETGSEQAKILDFGLAKSLLSDDDAQSTADGAVVGTYRSMAPEQARGLPIDHRVDLFALGVLLYEMVTGRSPFRGRTPYETLDRVVREAPEPPAHLRADLPPALATLIESLLAKEPERRPAEAAAVAVALERIGGLPDMRSGAEELRPVSPRPASAGASSSPGSDDLTAITISSEAYGAVRSEPQRRPGRAALWGMIVVALLIATVAGWFWLRPAPEPLRVAVLRTTVESGPDGELASAAAGLQTTAAGLPTTAAGLPTTAADLQIAAANLRLSVVRALVGLDGIAPVDPDTIGTADTVGGSPLEIARAVAAEEALTSSVSPAGRNLARIELARVRSSDGQVLWSDAVDVPTGPRDALIASSAVATALRRGFPGARYVLGPTEPSVRPEDYAEFLEVRRRLDGGAVQWAPELTTVEGVLAGSPNFVDAHLLAARLAKALYSDTRDTTFLDRAQAHLATLRTLAPDDPRRASLALEVALARGDRTAAEEVLGEMERLQPSDPAVLAGRSRIAEQEGAIDRAIELMELVVERRGTWWDLLRLADLEGRHGRVEEARGHLEQLLALVPGHTWGRAKLAEIELTYGDPERAEALYLELVANEPHRSDFTNLGLARLLMGRYGQAAESFREALAMAPGNTIATLNLADAEDALGKRETARELYGQVLSDLRTGAEERSLTPVEEMIRAQCLARLGKPDAAVELALATLQRAPEEAEVAYQAALVFVLAGEEASALASAKRALELGVAPRWFSLPAFAPLAEREELQRLLVR